MAEQIHGIANTDWQTFTDLMRDYRAGNLTPPVGSPTGRRPRGPAAPHAVCILRGHLSGNNSVSAELLELRPNTIGYDFQTVALHPIGQFGHFRLKLDKWQSPTLSGDARADGVWNILTNSPYRDFIVDVTLGSDFDAGNYVSRFRLEVQPDLPRPSMVEMENIVMTETRYHGTGTIIEDVHLAFPTLSPTPVRLGSQCVVARMNDGWAVIAAEPRNFHLIVPGEGAA